MDAENNASKVKSTMNIRKPSESKSKKVVVGVTGKLDSIVAAYLLKKQGFEVICLGIQFYSKEKEAAFTDRLYRENEDLYDDPEDIGPAPFIGVSVIENLTRVKSICEKVGLSFFAVDATGEYQHMITDKMTAAILGGIGFSPKVVVTKLIFDILLQKAEKLNADYISTGHYAKVVKNQMTKSFNIYVANDTLNDQSKDFCLLNQKILSKIILPFSEMRKVEVNKIGNQILKINFLMTDDEDFDFYSRYGLAKFVKERTPLSMLKEGVVLDRRSDTVLTDHDGIHNFHYGQGALKSKAGLPFDKSLTIIDIVYGNGTVVAGLEEDVTVKLIVLRNVQFQGEIDKTKPQSIYLNIDRVEGVVRGTMYFNNNSNVYVELDETYYGVLVKGEFAAFYNKPGLSGRLIGGGEIVSSGEVDNGQFVRLPNYDDYPQDDQGNTIDIYKFKF